jgi:hypothetical protein
VETQHLKDGRLDLYQAAESTVPVTGLLIDGDVILAGKDGRFQTAVVPKWLELMVAAGPTTLALRLKDCLLNTSTGAPSQPAYARRLAGTYPS